jgi:tRNA/tmRNA/rRNA uracil-C5-methylase (TrmA/RlmC/RlmD family)
MHQERSAELIPLSDMPLAVGAIARLGLFERTWPRGARLAAVKPSLGPAFVLVKEREGRWPHRKILQAAFGPDGQAYWSRLDARSFWQVHVQAPDALVRAVLGATGGLEGRQVWDLYSGAGLFTGPLADAVGPNGQVVAVEGDLTAHRYAAGNAAPWPWVNTVVSGVERALAGAVGVSKGAAAVLDPPRKGAGRRVMQALAKAQAERLVYVSCEAGSFARDVAAARECGYELTSLQALDLFPATAHVETVGVLQPRRQ